MVSCKPNRRSQAALHAHRRRFYRFDKKKHFIHAAQFHPAFKLQKNIDSHIEQSKQANKQLIISIKPRIIYG